MDKELLESNIQGDIFYFKRKAQKNSLEHLFDRIASIFFKKIEIHVNNFINLRGNFLRFHR